MTDFADSALSRILVAARGLVYSTAFVGLWGWLALTVRRYDGSIALEIPVWLWPVGLALVIAGGLFAAWCIATFLTLGRGTPAPFDPPRAFVAVGPYRFVRNPMYVGGLAVLAGSGLLLRSPAILALSVVALFLAHLLVVLYEEHALESRFGASYLSYKHRVRRWLPGAGKAGTPAA